MSELSELDDLYVGIDLGGTKILGLIANSKGLVLSESVLPTPAEEDFHSSIQVISEVVSKIVSKSPKVKLKGVGVAAAGAINSHRGSVVHTPQLPLWKNVPLVSILEKKLMLPVVIGNDANLAALSEHRYGVAQGVKNVLYVTISTGIGGGILIDGQIFTGWHGFAGEVGHASVDVNGPFGKSTVPGAVESFSSGAALARIADELITSGHPTKIKGSKLSAENIFKAFHEGDKLAKSVIDQGILHLGFGLTNMVNILDPEMLIIGGGLSKEWDSYIKPSVEIMRNLSFAGIGKDINVVSPKLGVNAGALGGVALAADHFAGTNP